MLNGDNFDENLLNSLWNNADWNEFAESLFEMQRDIALAARADDLDAVSVYQDRLTQSIKAKMLAVRHVVSNGGVPGVDGVQWSRPSEYMQAAFSLNSVGYHASPTRMVIISAKFSQKERRIKIPTYYDRAMHTLYAYALGPVEETTGDISSFAFRKNRSTQDVHAYVISALKKGGNFVLKTDVKSCYESINHDWLLSNIPIDNKVLREFLKAGHFAAGEFFPAEDHGISLGESISPILGNMVLNGLQKTIFEKIHGLRCIDEYCDGHLIRFADDILVTSNSEERAKLILRIIEDFLLQRGMHLSTEKTMITNIHLGFDFLSRHYVKNGSAIISYPSTNAVMKMEYGLRQLILPFRGSQKALIDKINKKLYGWASYHKISSAENAFRHIDVVVKALLLQLCQRLHPTWKISKIISQYFFKDQSGKYVYALKDKKDERVIRLADIALIKHIPQKYVNPYLGKERGKKNKEERDAQNVTGKYKAIWNRQGGKCFYCGEQILADQEKTLVQIHFMRSHFSKSLAYVHEKCLRHKIEFTETEDFIENYEDIIEVIKKLSNTARKGKTHRKFEALFEYFSQQQNSLFSMTFEDITEIIEVPLCKTAFKSKGYWLQKKHGAISEAWLSNGYKIKQLNLSRKKITFIKSGDTMPIKIPKAFREKRVPKNAKIELETFFKYIIKKYGLQFEL